LLHCSIFELGKQESDDAERMIAFLMKYDRRKVFFSIKKPKNELSVFSLKRRAASWFFGSLLTMKDQ